jgi:hypothetical protein
VFFEGRLRAVDNPHCRYRYLLSFSILQARHIVGGLFAFFAPAFSAGAMTRPLSRRFRQ